MKTILMLTAFALIAGWSTAALAEDAAAPTAPAPAPILQDNSATIDNSMENPPRNRPNCYNNRRCTGRPINHTDAHNCRHTGGSSWNDGQGGPCRTL